MSSSSEPADPAFDAGPVRPPPPRSPLDRLAEAIEPWRVSPRTLLFGVVVLAVAAGVAWWLLRPPAAPIEQRLPRAPTTPASGAAEGTASASVPTGTTDASSTAGLTSTTPKRLVVEAAGAVQRPGVYRLPSGSRVDDLVRAAGGLAPGADGDRLNLAAPLGDGQRLFVPKPGQEPPPAVSAVGGEGGDGSGAVPGTGAGPASATGTPTTPVDLNAADATQLDSLPGVGPATAQAILSYRSQHGPFHTVDDLLQVRGIGPAKLDQMRALVRVDG